MEDSLLPLVAVLLAIAFIFCYSRVSNADTCMCTRKEGYAAAQFGQFCKPWAPSTSNVACIPPWRCSKSRNRCGFSDV